MFQGKQKRNETVVKKNFRRLSGVIKETEYKFMVNKLLITAKKEKVNLLKNLTKDKYFIRQVGRLWNK